MSVERWRYTLATSQMCALQTGMWQWAHTKCISPALGIQNHHQREHCRALHDCCRSASSSPGEVTLMTAESIDSAVRPSPTQDVPLAARALLTGIRQEGTRTSRAEDTPSWGCTSGTSDTSADGHSGARAVLGDLIPLPLISLTKLED